MILIFIFNGNHYSTVVLEMEPLQPALMENLPIEKLFFGGVGGGGGELA